MDNKGLIFLTPIFILIFGVSHLEAGSLTRNSRRGQAITTPSIGEFTAGNGMSAANVARRDNFNRNNRTGVNTAGGGRDVVAVTRANLIENNAVSQWYKYKNRIDGIIASSPQGMQGLTQEQQATVLNLGKQQIATYYGTLNTIQSLINRQETIAAKTGLPRDAAKVTKLIDMYKKFQIDTGSTTGYYPGEH